MSDAALESERRGIERRVEMLEHELSEVKTQVAVMQATLNGLVSTMDSRHKAFERGQDLIMKQLDGLDKTYNTVERDLTMLRAAPIDVSKIVFTPKVLLTIIGMILSIIGGLQAATWGLKADMQEVKYHQATQEKLDDERAKTFAEAVAAIAKEQRLQGIQQQQDRQGR